MLEAIWICSWILVKDKGLKLTTNSLKEKPKTECAISVKNKLQTKKLVIVV